MPCPNISATVSLPCCHGMKSVPDLNGRLIGRFQKSRLFQVRGMDPQARDFNVLGDVFRASVWPDQSALMQSLAITTIMHEDNSFCEPVASTFKTKTSKICPSLHSSWIHGTGFGTAYQYWTEPPVHSTRALIFCGSIGEFNADVNFGSTFVLKLPIHHSTYCALLRSYVSGSSICYTDSLLCRFSLAIAQVWESGEMKFGKALNWRDGLWKYFTR